MIKDRVVVIYADTLEELQVKGIGWHHDHAWFHYFGKTENVPEELKFLLLPRDCYMGMEDGHDFIETTETTATCYYFLKNYMSLLKKIKTRIVHIQYMFSSQKMMNHQNQKNEKENRSVRLIIRNLFLIDDYG